MEKYVGFNQFMEGSDSNVSQRMIEKYRLVDFFWEFKESIFDSDIKIGKNSLIYGTFVYLDARSMSLSKFKCLIPQDVAEQVAREMRQAMTGCQKFAGEFGEGI